MAIIDSTRHRMNQQQAHCGVLARASKTNSINNKTILIITIKSQLYCTTIEAMDYANKFSAGETKYINTVIMLTLMDPIDCFSHSFFFFALTPLRRFNLLLFPFR